MVELVRLIQQIQDHPMTQAACEVWQAGDCRPEIKPGLRITHDIQRQWIVGLWMIVQLGSVIISKRKAEHMR